MQHKKIIQLAISAVLALAFIQFYLKQKEDAMANAYGMVEVLTAARDIPPRTELVEGLVSTMKVPLKYVAPGAIMVKIPAEAFSRVKGKVTVASTPEGTQIVQSNLMDPSDKTTGVAPLIPPGKRGYLLRLGNLDVARLLLPGDHIDILATFSVNRNGVKTKATFTILQNILVVSVGKDFKRSNEDVTGKKEEKESLVLSLALEPQEAQSLSLAQSESQGEISVIVRPHGENEVKQVPGITPNNLLGIPSEPPTPPTHTSTSRHPHGK